MTLDAHEACAGCGLPEAARAKYPPRNCPMKYPEATCPQRPRTSGFIRTLPRNHEANLPADELAALLVARAGKP